MTRYHGSVMTVIRPITELPAHLEPWSGAVWVSEIEIGEFVSGDLELVGGEQYTQARLLIRSSGIPLGFVQAPISNGYVDGAEVRDLGAKLPPVPAPPTRVVWPQISVVICTRDRPEHLRAMLRSLDVLDYPSFEVIVVDNNPSSGLTAGVVHEHVGVPVRLVDAPRQGLSVARNVGLRNADYDLVAYTDDDVVVDKDWLTRIAEGFGRDDRVACVCGMVPTSELLTPAQSYFDARVGWAERWSPETYSLDERLADPLFPLRVSEFGTGANFAVRRDVVLGIGGFDEALGAGAPAGSGEDMDMFVRVLLSDHLLVREPSALVWHSHRRTAPELEQQMFNYAVGLSAFMSKLMQQPRTGIMVLRRLPAGMRHFRDITVVDDPSARVADPGLADVTARERRGILRGPWELVRGRLSGRAAAPLTPRSAQSGLPLIAFVFAVLGALGAIGWLPSPVRAVAVLLFVLLAPGALICAYCRALPVLVTRALVPVAGLATTILAVGVPLLAGFYKPPTTLLIMAGVTAAGAGVRLLRSPSELRAFSSGRARAFHTPSPAPWVLLAASLAAFGYGVTTIRDSSVSLFGLLASASPIYAASILLSSCAFVVALLRREYPAAWVAIMVMIVCLRLPRVVTTEVPMYAWTYKHLGVVDYIQRHHALAHGVDIYNGWPGLFSLTAWYADLTGYSAIDIAHWFTPVFHVALAGLMYVLARVWRLNRDQALLATFLVVTLNWVEQDYFSPQAIGMILTAGILILFGSARRRSAAVALICILFAALTITHQLTPYWVMLAAVLLVLGRSLRPWWLLIPMALILGAFLATNLDVTSNYHMLSLDILKNIRTNDANIGATGQRVTSWVMRTLTGSVWLATVIVLCLRWRRKQQFWALAVLALSPILILGGQGYGGEAIFRVFLYSLPGCAIVLAPVWLSGLRSPRRRAVIAIGALVLATAMAAQAYFGSWYTNLMTRSQVTVAGDLLARGDLPAYMTPMVPAWPERSTADYVDYARWTDTFDHEMIFATDLIPTDFSAQKSYDKLMELVTARAAPTYIVLSKPMKAYGNYFGVFPGNAMDNLRAHLASDPRWKTVASGKDVWVYLYAHSA